MTLLGSFPKQPREVLDYDIDYSSVLSTSGETVASVSTEVSPTGALTATYSGTTANKVKFKVSGGTAAATYKITSLVTTSPSGYIYEDEVNVLVEEV